jgi:hypothetical protein
MKFCIILFLILAPNIMTTSAQTLKHGGKYESSYDGFKGETIVRLKKMRINCGKMLGVKDVLKNLCINFETAIIYPGRQFEAPGKVRLTLILETKDWQSRFDRNLSIALDNRSVNLGKMSLIKSQVDTDKALDVMRHIYETEFSFELLNKIVTSKKVAMKLGPLEFELTEKNLAALYDLAKRKA